MTIPRRTLMGKYPLVDNGRDGLEIGVRVALRLLRVKRQARGGRLYGLRGRSVLKRLGAWPLTLVHQSISTPGAGITRKIFAAAMEEQIWNSIQQH
jgi:hypothetical protein